MCGIAGILHRPPSQRKQRVGYDLLTMAACLQHRGSDSAGFAVFGAPSDSFRIEVTVPSGATLPEPQDIQSAAARPLANLSPIPGGFSAYLDNEPANSELLALAARLESSFPGAVVTSSGHSMAIRKTVGRADQLADAVSDMTGTHGIAHLRLATESRIDPAHAQPFWGRPFPDIAVTHNGHITNYHKLRAKFEEAGYSFASKNDSEVIGVYLGELMNEGATLAQALEMAVADLDGSFSFIAATKSALGAARDFFATKPLLYVEQSDAVALASEQQALRRLLGDNAAVREIQPKEIHTWEIH